MPQKLWLGPGQAKAKPWVVALAWPRISAGQSHLRPSQSQGFWAKLGWKITTCKLNVCVFCMWCARESVLIVGTITPSGARLEVKGSECEPAAWSASTLPGVKYRPSSDSLGSFGAQSSRLSWVGVGGGLKEGICGALMCLSLAGVAPFVLSSSSSLSDWEEIWLIGSNVSDLRSGSKSESIKSLWLMVLYLFSEHIDFQMFEILTVMLIEMYEPQRVTMLALSFSLGYVYWVHWTECPIFFSFHLSLTVIGGSSWDTVYAMWAYVDHRNGHVGYMSRHQSFWEGTEDRW